MDTAATMDFSCKTLIEILVMLIWACLCVPVYKNPLFTQFFFAEDFVSELCNAASLSFCPGLLQVIQASTPPAVSFFKNLPTATRGR